MTDISTLEDLPPETMTTHSRRALPYRDRDWHGRLAIMHALENVGSVLRYGYVRDGFTAAIGRGRYGATVDSMREYGFICVDLVYFPLGTDKPSAHLRHDSHGIPACCWLFAEFQPRID